MWPDSARYAQLAYEYLGDDSTTARQRATQLFCDDAGEHAGQVNAAQFVPTPDHEPGPVTKACLAANADYLVPTGSPRYQAIFATRPGYPLAVAALTPLTGMRFALWLVPVLSTLLAGLGLWRLLTLIGVRSSVAAGGQALLYVLPTGIWGVRPLTEGPVLLGVVIAMLGAFLLTRDRNARGCALLVVGYLITGLVKYSTLLPLAGVFAVVAVLTWLVRRSGHRGALLATAISVAAACLCVLVPKWLGLAGLDDTLQDSFTDHFAKPDVHDTLSLLWQANIRYWKHWIMVEPVNVALLFGTAFGGWALWRWHRTVAAIVLGCAAVGVVLTAVHPAFDQQDRLYVLVWLVAATGLPVMVEQVARRTVRQPVVISPSGSPAFLAGVSGGER